MARINGLSLNERERKSCMKIAGDLALASVHYGNQLTEPPVFLFLKEDAREYIRTLLKVEHITLVPPTYKEAK